MDPDDPFAALGDAHGYADRAGERPGWGNPVQRSMLEAYGGYAHAGIGDYLAQSNSAERARRGEQPHQSDEMVENELMREIDELSASALPRGTAFDGYDSSLSSPTPSQLHAPSLQTTTRPSSRPTPFRPVVSPTRGGIRAMPVRSLPLRPFATANIAGSQRPHAFPIPANGNTSRRKDEHLRPAANANSAFQTGRGGSTVSRVDHRRLGDDSAEQVVENMELEAESYFGKDGDSFEQALGEMGHGSLDIDARAMRPAPVQQTYPAAVGKARAGVKLRPVAELPDMHRSIFKFGVFNAMQSTCFHTIYHSDDNAVISAPTGAGKTAHFELAILRLFASADADAKVVYIAPTKSLCSERARDWKTKFGRLGLGWEVVELTGDSRAGAGSLKDVGEARIIVTTPEKWDAMTRRWHSHARLLAKLRLFCIDEVHLVGINVRGAVLEVVVSRMKSLGTDTRFIALSATIPNVEDVALWLGGPPEHAVDGESTSPAKVYRFNEDYRPCKLQKIVVGYPPKGNDWIFQSSLHHRQMELIRQYSSGKPVLIFCNTRKGCVQAAEALAKEYSELVSARSGGNLPWSRPPQGGCKPNDKKLAELFELGIAYHHAGVENGDRRLIEDGFINGALSIVCATSTLAVGVNLPARMVIIKGTKQFVGGATVEYSDLDILQMMGRAGRPQFDTVGVAVIMTEAGLKPRYEKLVNSETILESGLHKSLTEHLNSEITLRTITSVASALHWLRSTFLFVRIKRNPKFYALPGSEDVSPTTRIEEICISAVGSLVSSDIVEEQQDSDLLTPTVYGDMMSRYYLAHDTFLALKGVPAKSTMRALLDTVSSCSEFSEFRFRQGEKTTFSKVNKNLRYATAQVSSGADKVNIIIQVVLEGIPMSELKVDASNPTQDIFLIWPHAIRIAKCLVDLALERTDGVTVKHSLELLRSLICKAWDDTQLVLRQFDGVGEKSIKVRSSPHGPAYVAQALSEKGVNSIADLRASDPSRLELILNRNPPFGRKLLGQAKALPEFTLSIIGNSEEVLANAVRVHLTVELGLAVVKPAPTVKKGLNRYQASLLLLTSDGEWVEFRRTKLELLLDGPKSFDVSVDLCKPSQRIVGSLTCEDVAGIGIRTVYKPTTKAAFYPLPETGHSDGAPEKEIDLDAYMPIPRVAPPRKGSKSKTDARDEPVDQPTPVVLPNGNYACNHACSDKTKCRHLCCREGTPKPPRPPKAKTAKPAPMVVAPKKPSSSSKAKADALASLDRLEGPKLDRPPIRTHRLGVVDASPGSGVTFEKGPGVGKFRAIVHSDPATQETPELPPIAELVNRVRPSSFKSYKPVPPPEDDDEVDELADDEPIDELEEEIPPSSPITSIDSRAARDPAFSKLTSLLSSPRDHLDRPRPRARRQIRSPLEDHTQMSRKRSRVLAEYSSTDDDEVQLPSTSNTQHSPPRHPDASKIGMESHQPLLTLEEAYQKHLAQMKLEELDSISDDSDGILEILPPQRAPSNALPVERQSKVVKRVRIESPVKSSPDVELPLFLPPTPEAQTSNPLLVHPVEVYEEGHEEPAPVEPDADADADQDDFDLWLAENVQVQD